MGIGLCTLTVSARALGPDGRGAYAACISWAAILALCFSCSVGRVALKKASTSQNMKDWVPEALSAGIIFSSAGSILSILAALLISKIAPNVLGEVNGGLIPFMLVLIPLQVWSQFKNVVLLTTNQINIRSIAQISASCTVFCMMLILVVGFKMGPKGLLTAYLSGELVSAFLGSRKIWHLAGGTRWKLSTVNMRYWFWSGLKLHPNAVSSVVRAQTDILMLNAILTPAAVGIYQLASRLIDVMMVFPNATSGAMMAQVAGEDINSLWFKQKQIMMRIMGLVLIMSIFAYLVVPFLIPIIFGQKFEASGEVFRWLLPILIGKSIGGMMISQILGRGYFIQASILGVIVTGVNIALNWILIPRYGMMGAVYATLSSYAGVTIIINSVYIYLIDKRAKRNEV